MTHTLVRTLRILSLVAMLGAFLALPPLAHAAAEQPAATAEAAKAEAPAASAADVKEDAEKPVEKALTDAEKKAAIAVADDISKFDESKVVGHAKPWQVYYQEAESPVMKQLQPLHDGVLITITIITIFVLALLIYIVVKFNKKANPKPQTFTHNKTIEVIWTVIPILILVAIAIPSLRLHYQYYNNETIINNPDVDVKVVGHQWYWSYEYPTEGIQFDSNITKTEDLAPGAPRLLEVDNALVVPVNKVVRLQLTSADVIHAFALPSFGVKKGAVPGRLNETWFKAEREGIYYGQCSVLCGKLHGYMPIKIVVVSDAQYAAWVKGAKLKFG